VAVNVSGINDNLYIWLGEKGLGPVPGLEPIIHFMIPFFALTLLGIKPKRAFILSLFALLPDLDILFHVHRSPSHSIPILIVALAPVWISALKSERFRGDVWLASLALLSHPILDLFSGYTPILWPLFPYSLWAQAEVYIRLGSWPTIQPYVNLAMEPTSFKPVGNLDAVVVSGGGLILSLLILIPILARILFTSGMLGKRPPTS